ncbi:MAG TPA: alpha-amylase family glycosyl hydrolase [Acidimicrobiia bacterium]|nr:alpha-amylase family glycosyl hydrolase [Acidimicrobiia bacterium]
MPEMPADRAGRTWWRDGVLYQIYPRSYMDTNADGIGDLRGITERLDHLQWLGVDGIWLDPIMVSPNDDWGYDVADYVDVDPALGTLADADTLIHEAAQRGIRVILDLDPNHTSDRHPWFVDAKSSRDSRHRDWYVWADPKPDGGYPNNWTMAFDPRQPAWTLDEASGQYYLNQFLSSQPDLNWWNEDVRDAFDAILRFWFDRGVAGFRIDVAHSVIKDRELRDNPPATKDDHWYVQMMGQRSVYNACRPEVHDVLRRWRKVAETYDPPRVLIGETYVLEPHEFAKFYGDGDELNLAFNFMLLHSDFDASQMRAAIEHAEALLPADAWPVWTGGNHDNHRFPTRWCNNDPVRARAALVMLMGLRGTPFLYYGDEIGMIDTDVPDDRILDPVGVFHGSRLGRDDERTPMQWSTEPGAGFSAPGVEPWLPYGDYSKYNVADQRHDPDSTLSLTRDLIGLRDAMPELRDGAYHTLPAPNDNVWLWRRGERTVVACNLSDDAVDVNLVGIGEIKLSTCRARAGERVDAVLHLAPWEAAIVWRDA